jgi:uncharacterized protein (DUF2235 family)
MYSYKQTPLEAAQASLAVALQSGIPHEADAAFVKEDRAAQFARIVSSRWPTIHFMGVWDTVASVIVPSTGIVPYFRLEELPFTLSNPSVRIFRHALSIDERRRMFRPLQWQEPQIFMHNRFSATNNSEPQDTKQVWFAGVHGDIGGGYPESQSCTSKFPLIWMIEEAVKHGLSVDPRTVNHLAWGFARKGSPFTYVEPDFTRGLHDSMSPAWRLLEPIPKGDKYREWPRHKSLFGFYIPNAEPRLIHENARIHESVIERQASGGEYRPINMPAAYTVEPLSPRPRGQTESDA